MSFVITFYSACVFELRKQPWLNGLIGLMCDQFIALAIWYNKSSPMFCILFFVSVFEWTSKIFFTYDLYIFNEDLFDQYVSNFIEHTKKSVLQYAICDVWDSCDAVCFTLFTVTIIHSIQKNTKMRNWKTRPKLTKSSTSFLSKNC